ncbi:alpha/beta hydrolase [Aliiroseovarius subalbicans]|uniref:alpha/beta fold hydrolase n=1 Tax=Aliiroseovarius subalbicans TaxID=2925840 RepID=UPI001F598D24|nr:alpha/beta hydrolase [Aliiroseovarius subalbicans]MCI2399768.1 alpha/beta hydrolase [Aliiroseovarius subalbicans]
MGYVVLALLAGLIALPWAMELRRRKVDKAARKDAPGHFATLSQGVTHYEWHGPVTGPVMVMVHGLTSPSWVFAGLLRGLTMMGFRVLTYDLYGRGLSDRPRGAQDRDFFLRQLRDLLAELKLDGEISLFGYSMGGAIATCYAAEEPDLVDRLILLAPAGMDYTPAPLLKQARIMGRLGDWLWGLLGGAHLRQGARAGADMPSVIPDMPARMAVETRTRGYLRSVLSSERHMLGEYLEEEHRELARMYVAVVTIWGEDDDVIPLTSLGKLTEWNRDAYKFVVPGAGHALGYTHPQEVIAAIQENVREV